MVEGSGDLVCRCPGRHERIGLAFLALVVLFGFRAIADHKMGGLAVRPREIFIAALGIAASFQFAVAEPLTPDTTAVGGVIADLGKPADLPCFQDDGQGGDGADPRSPLPPRDVLGDRFEWWFQKFTVKLKNQTIESYDNTDLAKVRKALIEVPNDSDGRAVTSLGYNNMNSAKDYMNDGMTGNTGIVQSFSLKTWVTSPAVRNALLNGIKEEVIEELTGTDK